MTKEELKQKLRNIKLPNHIKYDLKNKQNIKKGDMIKLVDNDGETVTMGIVLKDPYIEKAKFENKLKEFMFVDYLSNTIQEKMTVVLCDFVKKL